MVGIQNDTDHLLKSLTWFGRDCDIESFFIASAGSTFIEVVDLVWKGLRQSINQFEVKLTLSLKSLTWFGRDCDEYSLEILRRHTP